MHSVWYASEIHSWVSHKPYVMQDYIFSSLSRMSPWWIADYLCSTACFSGSNRGDNHDSPHSQKEKQSQNTSYSWAHRKPENSQNNIPDQSTSRLCRNKRNIDNPWVLLLCENNMYSRTWAYYESGNNSVSTMHRLYIHSSRSLLRSYVVSLFVRIYPTPGQKFHESHQNQLILDRHSLSRDPYDTLDKGNLADIQRWYLHQKSHTFSDREKDVARTQKDDENILVKESYEILFIETTFIPSCTSSWQYSGYMCLMRYILWSC
jgi:hypothetical protein